MPVITLPLAEWMPDQFPLGSPGATTITNVVPRTATSYSPMPTAVAYSTALTGRCIGSYTMSDKAKNVMVFAGDRTTLYTMVAAGGAFFKVEGTGFTGAAWPDTQWAFCSFGTRVIACNYTNPAQTDLIEASAGFSNLSATAPRARYCEAVGDFVMFGNTYDSVDGVQPQRVWWPAIGDPTNWPTPGSTTAIQLQSDFQDLQQTDLGQVTGLAAGPLPTASVSIFCERGIWVGLYVGSPLIFSFRVADGAPGCISPRSIVKGHINAGGNISPVIYYLGEDGFYAFNGTSSIPIGTNKVDKFVLAELDPLLRSTVLGTLDPLNKLVFWAYSTTSSTGLYDRMVVFNWDVNRWSYINLANSKIEWFSRTEVIGYNLDTLDSTGYNIDTLPYSLDSVGLQGGTPLLSVFNSSHQLCYLSGANMAPTVETVEAELFPGFRARFHNTRPLVDATGGSIAVGVRERQADSVVLKTAVLMNAMGECPQRYTGRYVRARFTLPAAATFTHLSGVEIDAMQEGKR